MNGSETVKPAGNIFDLWDRIMEPFEPEEKEIDNQEKRQFEPRKGGR